MNNTPTFGAIRAPIVDKEGRPSWAFLKKLQEYESKLAYTLNVLGEIEATTPIQGRTEGIGTTVSQVNATGKLLSTDSIAADGTGSPLTGGKRGFQALDTNNRLANSFRATAVNVSNVPTSSTVLSNTGASTVIAVAASTNDFAPGGVAYNSGSVDPGGYGSYFVNVSDPTYAGGAVIYTFSTDPTSQVASEGIIPWGAIKTTGGTPQTGGGNTGGTTPGGGGGRAYRQLP